MKLTKSEKETIILTSEAETTANVYTFDKRLIAKLKKLTAKYPDKIYPEREESHGAVSYTVPKSCIWIHEPYSDERRRKVSDAMKSSGIKPPVRGADTTN